MFELFIIIYDTSFCIS